MGGHHEDPTEADDEYCETGPRQAWWMADMGDGRDEAGAGREVARPRIPDEEPNQPGEPVVWAGTWRRAAYPQYRSTILLQKKEANGIFFNLYFKYIINLEIYFYIFT